MEIENLTLGGHASNSYLVTEGQDAVMIDCAVEPALLRERLAAKGATLHAILLTHGHYDHYVRIRELREAFDAPVYLCEADADFPGDTVLNAYHVFFGVGTTFPPADRLFRDGDTLTFGALTVSVMQTPGHTPGSVLYRVGNALFTGDTLMACGYGRTTFAGGNTRAMRDSLQRIATLPHHLTIFPGHGEGTMLGTAIHNIFR